jgi:archaellum component FlaC
MKILDSLNNISKINDTLDRLDKLSENVSELNSEKELVTSEINLIKEDIKAIKAELDLTLVDIVKCSTVIKTHQEAIMKLFEAYAKLLIKKSDPDEVDKILNDKPKKNNNNLN